MKSLILSACVFGAALFNSACASSGPVKGMDFAYQGEPPEDATMEEFHEWREETMDERCAWWKNDRFGMFIHWGLYAVPAGTYKGRRIGGIGEWIMNRANIPVEEYREYAKEFNPVKYDPDAWVRLAKEAGMRYIVITAKHHDGFALFDSEATDWDIVDATPYGKDLLKPLAEACRKHGLKLGLYYSQAQDWVHPGGAATGGHWDDAQKGDMDEYIREIAVPQVREILSNYGTLGVIWWDTPTNMNRERAEMLYSLLKLQPHIISNDRLLGEFEGDYGTPEQHIPGWQQEKNWETCMTMNGTWGFKSYDEYWKSTETLIRNLVDIVSKGGNYLLNVGPKADGTIPEPSVERLKEIGEWMDENGSSIYGCLASPFKLQPAWGRVTRKENKLYLHVFERPESGVIEIRELECDVEKVYLLSNPADELDFSLAEGMIKIELPAELPNPIDTVFVLEVDAAINVKPFVLGESDQGVVELKANYAKLHGESIRIEQKGSHANIGYWINRDEWAEWEFEVDKPGRFEIVLDYARPESPPENEYLIEAGSQILKGTVESTGDWGEFRTFKAGSLTIENSGKNSIAVKPAGKSGGALMNLRSIKMKRNTEDRR